MQTTVLRCLLLFSLAIVDSSSYAASGHEQDQLSLVQQQLDIIERLATRAEAARALEPIERYRFDYPRLTQDIQRIRQGVQSYLFPSRAQPRDPSELVGDYRLDTPIAETSP
ncbi:RAQPRD family integrative conjugative element protein [Pseudomonas fluorescens]|uniref:integrative conjugative element protein, RAQPRD family n=1 Tax=Pseudomonas fluorescens TaxID=294 RepID=UPI00177E70E7|nr:RAQPRD family integrative conjugative element protein [Pseudomonas fluorescens]MBD8235979.1 RAQPRD family integrative conjugative element protein [Pseudomonas fluorescens]MDY0894796.1 RAQPRD family integrative conjugative element protein [Pseudomonas fluorescens]